MNKKMRLSLAIEMFGNKKLLKAIAMLLLVRKKTKGKDCFRKFRYSHISKITGMHSNTIKERLHTLIEYGLACFDGETLMFRSITSRHTKRNIRLSDAKFSYKSIKDVEHSLFSLLIVILQNRKEFCKRTIRNAHDGKDVKSVKTARLQSRKYGYGNEYVERGLSYRTIARKLGVCIKTAVETVKFGIKKGFFSKETHFLPTFMPNVNFMEVFGYTFTTKNYGFVVIANTYTVAPLWHGNK